LSDWHAGYDLFHWPVFALIAAVDLVTPFAVPFAFTAGAAQGVVVVFPYTVTLAEVARVLMHSIKSTGHFAEVIAQHQI
jgi:hypothetical protein